MTARSKKVILNNSVSKDGLSSSVSKTESCKVQFKQKVKKDQGSLKALGFPLKKRDLFIFVNL